MNDYPDIPNIGKSDMSDEELRKLMAGLKKNPFLQKTPPATGFGKFVKHNGLFLPESVTAQGNLGPLYHYTLQTFGTLYSLNPPLVQEEQPEQECEEHQILRAIHGRRYEYVWSDTLQGHVRIGEHINGSLS